MASHEHLIYDGPDGSGFNRDDQEPIGTRARGLETIGRMT
jgi:hypothetical protein